MNLRPAVLGAADGLVSLSGVVAAAEAAGGHHFFVARLGMAAACSGTVSMANAEFASEGSVEWDSILSMGAGTLAGAAIPVLPLFVLGGSYGIGTVVLCACLVALAVSCVRKRINRRSIRWNLATTYLGLAVGVGIGLAFGA